MKTYNLEIFFSQDGVGVTEKASPGISLTETRLIISVLEEYKRKLLDYILVSQSIAERKEKPKND